MGRLERHDPTTSSPRDIYHLLASLVAPRPIAWVSTESDQGVVNLAPFSFFTISSGAPPSVIFVIEDDKDTLKNLRANPKLVVNLPSESFAEAVEATAIEFPPQEAEMDRIGLVGTTIMQGFPPAVDNVSAALVCELDSIHAHKRNSIVIANVQGLFVDPTIFVDGRIDFGLYRPLGRLSGRYSTVGSAFKVARPKYVEVQARGARADDKLLEPLVRSELRVFKCLFQKE